MARIYAGLVACIAYVFQWGYDGNQPSIVSIGATSRLSGNLLEDDGSSACVLSLTCVRYNQPSFGLCRFCAGREMRWKLFVIQ